MPIVKVPLYKQLNSTSEDIILLTESFKMNKKGYKDLVNEADLYAKNILGCKEYIVEYNTLRLKPYLIINEDLNVSGKGLHRFLFPIKHVKGNVNVENNKFTKFSDLPEQIDGDLRFGGNYIIDFNGCDNFKIKGNIYGSASQNRMTKYRLCKENLKLYKQGLLNENSVKIKSKNQYGQLINILDENTCVVKVNYTNKIINCRTDDVDCLYNVTPLLNKL